MERFDVIVTGGVNVDIGGMPDGPLLDRDSNPGRVRFSLGGVGQNIARGLSRLGVRVSLLTALGGDPLAQQVTEGCAAAGIDLAHALRAQDAATSVYLFISDERGDMKLAVSDMDVCRHLTPDYFAGCRGLLDRARAVVLDTNLPAESVAWLAENCTAPLFADPVSAAKAERLRPVLGRLHALTPNRREAELLSGVSIRGGADIEKAADRLLETGLREVYITMGSDGVYAAGREERYHVPCFRVPARNMTGAGDAFMAGLVRGWLDRRSLYGRTRMAAAAAAVAVQSAEAVGPGLSMEALQTILNSGGTP